MTYYPIFDLVGKDTAVAWAAAGAEQVVFHGWWILKGDDFTPCGIYEHLYPALYESSETVFDLPNLEAS